jgi:hypothetical protein
MKTELLAWCQFPEPQGTAYTERDLCDPKKAAQLLDRAQVHRAWIAREGWQALWRIYGLEGLLKLNQRGGWFDTDSDDVAAEQIRHRSLVAGYDPSTEADQFGLHARTAGVMTLARDG